MLTPEQVKRYSRQIALNEIGEQGQLRINNAKVLVIGCGGLGCPVLQYLTAAGVGRIAVIDGDKVDLSNLQRQILFSVDDVGEYKVEAAKKKLLCLNPHVSVNAIVEYVSEENVLNLVSEYDIIIDCSDNFPTRYLINDACVIAQKPFVFGSVLHHEGQVSVFNYNNGPTYRCLFADQPEDSESCSEAGVIGFLPGIIGSLQAGEALKIAAGFGEVLSGKLLVVNTLTCEFSVFEYPAEEKNKNIKKIIIHKETSLNSIEISAQELQNALENNENVVLFDLREEYEKTPLKYLVTSLNFDNILQDFSLFKEFGKKYVFVCSSGKRSKAAVIHLRKNLEISNVFSLIGGTTEIEKIN
jgi:sulfur-carrier protein adenylyltransferase/sulfurtransferase